MRLRPIGASLIITFVLLGTLPIRADAYGDDPIISAAADSPGGTGGSGGGPGSAHAPVCDAWARPGSEATHIDVPGGVTARQDPDGRISFLFTRVCDGVRDWNWIPQQTSQDAANSAHDEVTRRLPHSAPQLAPPLATGGIVNVNTWIGLDQPAPVSVTATVPGVWATVSATAYDVSWTPGDGSTVDCGNLGVVWHPGKSKTLHDAPCGWTPKYPSLPKFTNTNDLAYHGHFDVTWRIIWTGSDGSSGTYDDIVVTSPTLYKVSEIQTIGDG